MRVITNRKETQCATCGKALYGKSTTHPDLRGVAVQEHDGGEWRAYCPEHAPKARKCAMCGVINAAPGRHHNTNCGGWTKRDAGQQEWVWPARDGDLATKHGLLGEGVVRQSLTERDQAGIETLTQALKTEGGPFELSQTFTCRQSGELGPVILDGGNGFFWKSNFACPTFKVGVVYRLEVSEKPPPDPEAIYRPVFHYNSDHRLTKTDLRLLAESEHDFHRLIDVTDTCTGYKIGADLWVGDGDSKKCVGTVQADGSYTLNGNRFSSRGILLREE
jgi:hypothetical protein